MFLKVSTIVFSTVVLGFITSVSFSNLTDGQGLAEHKTTFIVLLVTTAYYSFIFYQLKLGWEENKKNHLLAAFWCSLLPFLLALIIFLILMNTRMGC
jgi:amino acid transporter